ncbi:hypothetical protein Tco_0405001 [Tanacetum coccineum]
MCPNEDLLDDLLALDSISAFGFSNRKAVSNCHPFIISNSGVRKSLVSKCISVTMITISFERKPEWAGKGCALHHAWDEEGACSNGANSGCRVLRGVICADRGEDLVGEVNLRGRGVVGDGVEEGGRDIGFNKRGAVGLLSIDLGDGGRGDSLGYRSLTRVVGVGWWDTCGGSGVARTIGAASDAVGWEGAWRVQEDMTRQE